MICLVLVACETDAGSSNYYCYSDGPIISNLVLARESAVVGEGGGSIAVNVSIDYRTRSGAKIIYVEYRVETADGIELLDSGVDRNLKGKGSFSFQVPIETQAAMSLVLRVRLVDECIEKSKWLESGFEILAPAPLTGKTGYATASAGKLIYFIGGQDADGQASNDVLQFDSESGLLLRKAALPEARSFAAATVYNDTVYVFGGSAYGFPQESSFAYDTDSETWTAAAPMSAPATNARATVVNDMICVDSSVRMDCYQPLLDLWTQELLQDR